MADRLSRHQRSENMRHIRGKDTAPELAVRRILHGLGYRYRLHQRVHGTRPDIVFRSLQKVIFVHGCFWHRHRHCRYAYTPKSREEFWRAKFDANVERDARAEAALRNSGWKCLVVWECETADVKLLTIRLTSFLGE